MDEEIRSAPDAGALHARVADELIRRLNQQQSPLTADPAIADHLRSQVERVLSQTFARLRAGEKVRPPAASPVEVGEMRARQNIHPADSLTAATLLFEIGLEQIVLKGRTGAEIALALNASIMENVVPASVTYVDVLLQRLAVAHSEERLSISRELHDRVAHGIAAGIQRVQLGRQHTDSYSDRLEEALKLLEAALDETRALALDLRHSVGEKRLDTAISDYVTDMGASHPTIEARSEGAPRLLPTGAQEEAFIIVREAVHNAQRHSSADRIQVISWWYPDRLVVTVADDGIGFDRDRIRTSALGLIAAQERAELIGADLSIQTSPHAGTTVTLSIPQYGARP